MKAASDETLQPIRANPARILLGDLPYGEKGDPVLTQPLTISGFPRGMMLTEIDLSHAQGVQVLVRRDGQDEVALTLKIDVRQFSANQPFGAFIKKLIRVETSSPNEPQLIIPIFGWLGANESPRDFNRFVFNGAERWQGWWGTPNIAGSVLAPLILFLLGSGVWLWANRARGIRWLNMGLLILLLVDGGSLVVLLAVTYSRGAWIAFAVGSLVMLAYPGQLRKSAALLLLFFGMSIFFLPSGLKRVESYSRVEEDLSVANRLKLWTGALQIMAEHPVSGVGAGQFGEVFERDYQRFDHRAKNSTAVSDYFTFGAERGVLFLASGIGLIFFIVQESFRGALRGKSLPQLTLTATLVAILVASAFSTLWFVPEYQWTFVAALFGLLVFTAIQVFQMSTDKSQSRSFLMRLLGCLIGTLVAIGVLSQASLLTLPTKTFEFNLELSDHNSVSCRLIEPRWKPSKGLVVYFQDPREDVSLLCHTTLRPLAALGWRIVSPATPADQTQVGPFIEALNRKFSGQKLFLAGDGNGARIAWLASTEKLRKMPTAGAGFGFLSSDMDLEYGNKLVLQPFLVGHNLYDDQISANTAIRLQQKIKSKPSSLTVKLTQGDSSHFSQDWMDWLKTMDQYFSAR